MIKKILLLYFVFGLTFLSLAVEGDGESSLTPKQKFPKGLTLRGMPAIFWNTALAEVEYNIPNTKFATGITGYYAWGINKNTIYTVDKSKNGGYGVDVFVKYYFGAKVNTGFFAAINVSYNTIVYPEGTVRPFALNNNLKKSNTPADKPLVFNPDPFNYGVGVGYQIMMIPKRVYTSILAGCQISQNYDGSILPTIYLVPSISYVF